MNWETAKEAAFRLGVHPVTIWQWGKAGHIARRRINSQLYLYLVDQRPWPRHRKLTSDQACAIRALYGTGLSLRKAAALFHISHHTVRQIWAGLTWKS